MVIVVFISGSVGAVDSDTEWCSLRKPSDVTGLWVTTIYNSNGLNLVINVLYYDNS
jgi:hypothetical protein